MELTKKQIKEIAEELDVGMKVFVNTETKEIKSVLDFEDTMFLDEDAWEEEKNEIEENFDKYISFEKMDSSESFDIMVKFVETVDDEELKNKLDLGLNLSRPFRNFKDIIDYSGEYRNKWFEFKTSKYIEYVKEELEMINRRI